ncbi:hypothetical protein ANO11243_061750 [Dothideomycetidae sp. 11243]|nr:hypothetical protein ANO11243_061750 [fungal sp. No.11243]
MTSSAHTREAIPTSGPRPGKELLILTSSEHARNQPRNANIGHARASRTPAFRAEDTRFDDTIVQQNGASHHATPESSIIVEDSAESNATSVTRASAPKNSSVEVVDTNVHTNNSEFYGPASLAAFLRNVQTISHDHNAPKDQSLASLLHNTEFNPGASYTSPLSPPISDTVRDRFHFRMAKQYLDAYFSNIHKIQPVFDEDIFLSRCEDLWFDKDAKAPLTFIALYYATMSLGCLVMTPDQSGAHENRFKWSRKLFDDAVAIVARLGTTTDMEMVQCFYMLWPISMLVKRHASPWRLDSTELEPVEIPLRVPSRLARRRRGGHSQTSFALGRPDSLGADGFHNQPLPSAFLKQPMSETHVLHIVPQMVSLSRIMRKVAHELFVQPRETHERLLRAQDLDNELQNWLMHVPPNLSWEKDGTPRESDLKARRHRLHLHKQAVVLRLRE